MFPLPTDPLWGMQQAAAQNEDQPVQVTQDPEEERRRRSREAFQQLLAQIAQPAASQQPELDEPQMMQKIMARRYSPEREAQLAKMRSESPDDIARRMAGEFYYGNAKSTPGKIGMAALRVIAGMTGVPSPDFGKMATERWLNQQKIANEQETTESRLAAAELKGYTDQRKMQQMAQSASERNRTLMAIKLADTQVKEAQLEQKRMMDAHIAAGLDAKTAKIRSEMDAQKLLNERLGPIASVMGLKDPALIAGVAKQYAQSQALTPEERALADSFGARYTALREGFDQNKAYRPGTPDRIETLPTPTLRNDQNGNPVQIIQNMPRLIRGREQQGRPNAASEAYFQGQQPMGLGGQPAPSQAQPQPVRPQQQVAPQLPQVPQPQAQTPRPQGVPPEAREISPEIKGIDAQPNTQRFRAWFQSANRQMLQNPPPKDITKDDEAAKGQVTQSAESNSVIRDAYLTGELGKISGPIRSIAAKAGADKPFSAFYQVNPSTQRTETALQRLTTEETAAYLKKISGAQVSHQEFDRIKGMFPQTGNPEEQNLQLALWNTIVPSTLLQLEQSGALVGQNATQIGNALAKIAQQYTAQYLNALRDIRAKGNTKDARGKYNLGAFTDIDSIATEVLRSVYAQNVGGVVAIPHSDRRFGVGSTYVHVPSGSLRAKEMDDEREKKLREARERYQRGER